jgi:hypothetical protein
MSRAQPPRRDAIQRLSQRLKICVSRIKKAQDDNKRKSKRGVKAEGKRNRALRTLGSRCNKGKRYRDTRRPDGKRQPSGNAEDSFSAVIMQIPLAAMSAVKGHHWVRKAGRYIGKRHERLWHDRGRKRNVVNVLRPSSRLHDTAGSVTTASHCHAQGKV